jgi:hypothetical protein
MAGEASGWRKSTRSGNEGNCVEIGAWRKCTKSGGNGACIEVGGGLAQVGVRDTKECDLGTKRTVLKFSPAAWAEFTRSITPG